MPLLEQLRAGLRSLGEKSNEHPCESYLAYIALLEKWNKTYNLSGIKQAEAMLTHHVLDSLATLPFLSGSSGLDVGSGAGLPGFILALARPQMQWCLLDSNEKKTRFLTQAVLELQVTNIEIVCARIEDFRPEQKFSDIICRALMPAVQFCEQTQPLLENGGRMMMMKGPAVKDEMDLINCDLFQIGCASLSVPGLDAERRLLLVERQHE